jgi:3-hydroxybutyryl-CoA dehydrogenase
MDQLNNIGIVGEGKMGSSIFFYLLGFDFKLRWLCSSKEGKAQAVKSFEKKLKTLGKCGVMNETESAFMIEKTVITVDPADLKDCDLVIEAVTEGLETKRGIFNLLDETVKPACILASNSSSIRPSELIPSERREDKVAGMHFFFPVNLKKSVELICGKKTSEQTKSALQKFLQAIDKNAFLQEEENAFILNRLLLDVQAGAYLISLEGKLSYRQIDKLVKDRLFPVGIFDFFDHVGIDVMLASIRSYTRNSEKQALYSPLISKMEELVQAGRLGLKTRAGFYDYCQPGSSDRPEEIEELPGEDYLEAATCRLRKYFMDSVSAVMNSGSVLKDELSEAVRDYLGMEEELF